MPKTVRKEITAEVHSHVIDRQIEKNILPFERRLNALHAAMTWEKDSTLFAKPQRDEDGQIIEVSKDERETELLATAEKFLGWMNEEG